MTGEESFEILSKEAKRLGEIFDHVQILVTWNEEGETKSNACGCGNWYARQGIAKEFIQRDLAQDQAIQIAEHLCFNNPPEDGDEWKPLYSDK